MDGDAQQFLESSHDSYDVILLDAERDEYINYWNHLKRIIHPKGGVLIVDNVISHADQVEDFISVVNADSNFLTTTLTLGAGLFVVVAKG